MSDAPAPAEPFHRRHPRLTVFGGLLLVLLLVAGIFALRIRSLSAERWSAFMAGHEKALARVKALDGKRAPLAGPEAAGNAWDVYMPAVEALTKDFKALAQADLNAIAEALKAEPKPEAKEAASRIVAARQAQLDPIRTGIRNARALSPVDWSKGYLDSSPIGSSHHVGNLLALSARIRRESGDIRGALDDLTAGLQYGLDTARPPMLYNGLIALSIVRVQAGQLRLLLADPKATPADLERTADLAAAAERQIPALADLFEVEFVGMDEMIRQAIDGTSPDASKDFGLGAAFSCWRYGFSPRLMAVDLRSYQDRFLEAVRKAETQDYDAAARAANAVMAEVERSSNELAKITLPGIGGSHRSRFEVIAMLRLIQAAARIRLGKSPADAGWPVDPFNHKPLGCKVDGATTKLWSVGRDGVDSPTGKWTPDKDDEDIVLEVKK